MRSRSHTRRAIPLVHELDARRLLSGFQPFAAGGYTPADVLAAYGLNGIKFASPSGAKVSGNGAGETIALIEEYHDPNIQSDLNTFDAQFGLPDPSLTVINQAGNRTDNSWALEESMDVEWAHAIAPGAKILVVEAAPAYSQTQELLNQLFAVNTARQQPGVDVISMSWGFAETANEPSYDGYFTTPAGHTGITFIASSGDYGYPWYPSTSPNVLAVGGTSLYLSSSGTYQGETAWFWTGGGYSAYEREPSYQSSVQTTGDRSTPDVAFDANPSTGVAIFETSPRSGKGSWQVSGGTSLGAPAWAGIIAIVDQGRALAGKGSLDGPTQTLPALYSLPKSDFKSVTSYEGFLGTGGLSSLLGMVFSPDSGGANANIATGRGSPNGPSLIADLAAATITSKPPTPSASSHIGNGVSAKHIRKSGKDPADRRANRKVHHNRHTIKRAMAHSLGVAEREAVPRIIWNCFPRSRPSPRPRGGALSHAPW
jgi:hypothetical protein